MLGSGLEFFACIDFCPDIGSNLLGRIQPRHGLNVFLLVELYSALDSRFWLHQLELEFGTVTLNMLFRSFLVLTSDFYLQHDGERRSALSLFAILIL